MKVNNTKETDSRKELNEKKEEEIINKEKKNESEIIKPENKEDQENEFYKEICFSSKEVDLKSRIIKYESFFNFKNYFILSNKTSSKTDDLNQMISCEICQTKKSGDFLVCDICYAAVHEKCLTVKNVKNDWICERCKFILENGESKVVCKFCKKEKGLLMLDDCDEWYHSKCLNLHNKKMVLKTKICPNQCSFCHRNADNLILCQKKGCNSYFHLKCASKETNQFDFCKFHIDEIEQLLNKKTKRLNP